MSIPFLIFGVVVIVLMTALAVAAFHACSRLDRLVALAEPVKVEVDSAPKPARELSPAALAALIRASTPVPAEPVDHFATPSADECDHRKAKAAIRKADMKAGEPITCPTCAAELIVGERNDEGKPTVARAEKAA